MREVVAIVKYSRKSSNYIRTYGIELWGRASQLSIAIIQRAKLKILRVLMRHRMLQPDFIYRSSRTNRPRCHPGTQQKTS